MCARFDKLTILYTIAFAWLLLPACATSEVEDAREDTPNITIPSLTADMSPGTGRDMTSQPVPKDMASPNTGTSEPDMTQDMASSSPEDQGMETPDMAEEPDMDEVARPCQADNQCVIGSYCDLNQGICASDCLGHDDCPAGQTCEDTRGRCEDNSADCGNTVCEPFEDCETCPTDCGCGPNQDCDQGVCICQDACAAGASECDAGGTRSCTSDDQGCLVWSPTSPCPGGCMNGMCSCMAACGADECGMDGCGGSCGTCTFTCGANNLCTRQLTINYVETSCLADCQDTFDPTDPFIKITIAGQTYAKDEGARDRCGMTRTAENWTVGGASKTFTFSELQNATVEVYDADTFNSDDLCARWSNVNLTMHGTQTLVSADGLVRVSLRVNR